MIPEYKVGYAFLDRPGLAVRILHVAGGFGTSPSRCSFFSGRARSRSRTSRRRPCPSSRAPRSRPAHLVRSYWVKPGAIIIDVGITKVTEEDGTTRIVGGCAAEELGHARALTPVPGEVGPMIIACPLSNTVTAPERLSGKALAPGEAWHLGLGRHPVAGGGDVLSRTRADGADRVQ